MSIYINEAAIIDDNVIIGDNSKIWHFTHLQSGSVIGENCTISQGCYIGSNVIIGNNVKLQNNISVFDGVEIEDNVFCGPSVVFTNDICPRSEFSKNKNYIKTFVKNGATIGANSTIICGTTIGRYAFVGGGSVVTKNVPDYGLAYGNPAKQRGWICRCTHKLSNRLSCEKCGAEYIFKAGSIEPIL